MRESYGRGVMLVPVLAGLPHAAEQRRHVTARGFARPSLTWIIVAAMTLTVLIILAGLMGASGVMLAAAGAHAAPGAGLESAGYMLLFHAAAVLGGAALLQHGLTGRHLLLLALAGWVLGAALFSGDIALRAFAGHRLFPMAAPTGGIILIAAWLALAASAIAALLRS
jgi:uncharacterized membrane protein YgdD (TMEM256/DUF423 family)